MSCLVVSLESFDPLPVREGVREGVKELVLAPRDPRIIPSNRLTPFLGPWDPGRSSKENPSNRLKLMKGNKRPRIIVPPETEPSDHRQKASRWRRPGGDWEG